MIKASIKSEFPLLVNNPELVYLDTAATSQKPKRVIDALKHYYEFENANIHRGVYRLSAEATAKYDLSREKVRSFLNAKSADEIVFVRGTTEAINLVAQTFARTKVGNGDQILLSGMEHHSNIVPWQLLAESVGAKIKIIPMSDKGELELDRLEQLLNDKVKLLSIVHVSNTLGTINPLKEIITQAKLNGVPVIIDGAQAASHFKIDVQDLDCDFYAFSGHKVYGPTGIGVLYGKKEYLEKMPPYQGGGDMIQSVTFERSTYMEPPQKFEAGTPNIAGAIGLAESLSFIEEIGWEAIAQHEKELLSLTIKTLHSIPGIQFIGEAKNRIGAMSFNLENIHPHDVGTILDANNIAVRTGHHCTQPIMDRFCIPATVRASFGIYNTADDITKLANALSQVKKILK